MKHSVAVKFLAFILCTLSLVTVIFSGTGIAFMELYDLYQTPLDVIQQEQLNFAASSLAEYHARWTAAENLSNVPPEMLPDLLYSYYVAQKGSQYAVEVYENGTLARSVNDPDKMSGTLYHYSFQIAPAYPVVIAEYDPWESPAATIPAVTQPSSSEQPEIILSATPTEEVFREFATASAEAAVEDAAPTSAAENAASTASVRGVDQDPLYSEDYYTYHEDDYGNPHEVVYTIGYYEGPTYDVRVTLSSRTVMDADFMLVSALYPYRDYYIPAVLVALILFIITLVFLFSVAGRRSKGEVHLAAINRIPLDLHALCCCALIAALIAPVFWLFESALYESSYNLWDNPHLCLLICGLCGFGISSLIIGFLYAFAAQSKAPNHYWLRHSCIGWCFGLLGKALRWTGRGIACAFRGCRAVVRMLPIIWQWLLTAFLMVLVPFIFFLLAINSHGFGELFWGMALSSAILADIALVCYGAWCFGTLLKGARKMAQGNLDYQIDTRYLLGCFKDFAEQMNKLAGAAQTAAEQQMKSERMKAELITNVSHDIKTPLTSIINYVDLLKKPHSEEDGIQYLDVLDRQSQRLKKLIGDLMDMSKASSGNVAVQLGQVDAVETVNQALGEFSDKLEKAGLIPVFRHPDTPVIMRADGKLVWRVLSNLLSNAVKYALTDTRLYVDLMELEGNAVLAIKNISRDELNVDAEELMERFVRGDTSRNTEGSGLGLNIAKSLVELQKGQMHLMVDGDLFKVTLVFPLA